MSSTTQNKQLTLRQQHDMASTELERYRLLIESVQDYAIFLLDAAGHIQTWNKGAERFKGYKPYEIIGKHFSVFYTQEDKEAHKPERELEIATRLGRVEDEDWRVRKDGSRFWASVLITALFDSSGELTGFAKVTRDLTDRKRIEDDLRRANIQLRHQQNELQVLNRAKDEFVSLASHQLRTPATAVKQYLGLLLEGFAGELTDEQLAYIRKAYESNDRQIATVNDLLYVAQIDAGKIVLQRTMTDVNKMVTNAVDEQRDTFRSRKQRIELELSAVSAFADIDAERFRMVVQNLVDNASKYTPEHGTIRVKVVVADSSIKVSVSDTGVGIRETDITKLFEKFARIPNKLSPTVGGSGLGLYWARRITELHGGTIQVQSQKDMGSTFTVSLPKEPNDA